jgi:hypothetical protein
MTVTSSTDLDRATATAAVSIIGPDRTARPPLWFLRTTLPPFTRRRQTVLHWLLRLATAGAFIGHGAYGALMAKPGWYPFLAQLGLGRAAVDDSALLLWIGGFEMLLGILALALPIRALLLFLCGWKMGSEFVWYPLAGLPAWEFVERWSNYTAPLALLLVRGWPTTWRAWFR